MKYGLSVRVAQVFQKNRSSYVLLGLFTFRTRQVDLVLIKYWEDKLCYLTTLKSRVLTRVNNQKIRFLDVFKYEMCFKTRCGSN